MDRKQLGLYFNWLGTASDEQLSVAHQDIINQIPKFQDAEIRKEAKFRLRLLEGEILARTEVYKLHVDSLDVH